LGNDPDMRLKLQSGEAYAGCTWGVYTRRGGLLFDVERGGPSAPTSALKPAE